MYKFGQTVYVEINDHIVECIYVGNYYDDILLKTCDTDNVFRVSRNALISIDKRQMRALVKQRNINDINSKLDYLKKQRRETNAKIMQCLRELKRLQR